MWLLVLAPIIWISLPSKTLPTRIGALAATAFPILMALRTTSRGGFVGMFAMLVIVFFLSSFKMRIIIASLSAVGLVVMLAFLPASLRSRLAASARITSSETNIGPGDQGQIGGDNSAVSRGTLLETGIALTLENPVIGVGPGNFGPTVVDIGRSQGFDWVPLNTHNAYTQISSETGIPGFILYLVLIGFSAKSVVSLLRQTSTSGATPDSQLHLLASGMLVSLAGVLTCIFFLSEGYNQLVYLWLGIACGLRLIIPKPQSEEEEFIEMDPEQLSPAP
jgi:O-antigen ligase